MNENHEVDTWRKALKGAIEEISPEQSAILHQMTPAQRFQIGCSISNLARRTVGNRIRKRNPDLSQAEAERLALQEYYSHDEPWSPLQNSKPAEEDS